MRLFFFSLIFSFSRASFAEKGPISQVATFGDKFAAAMGGWPILIIVFAFLTGLIIHLGKPRKK